MRWRRRGLLSSTASHLWALAIYGASVGLIVALTAWRIDTIAASRRAKAGSARTRAQQSATTTQTTTQAKSLR